MINSVRQTVMSILNKNNYGYISPSDFNLYAKQAQLDLFEDYFYQYNYQLNKENKRMSGTGYADITKGLEEVIDSFSSYNPLQQFDPANKGIYASEYIAPSLVTTGDEYYLLNKLLVYSTLRKNGTTNSILSSGLWLVDTTQDFNALGVQVGDHVVTIVNNVETAAIVLSVSTNGQAIQTTEPIFIVAGQEYSIFDGSKVKEAEQVNNSKITMLNNSILTKPTLQYPAYTERSGSVSGSLSGFDILSMYPNNQINTLGQVMCQYIRFPFAPKWTYLSLTNGEPSFDPTQPDYQDFELPNDDEVNLVNKILQYAGMSIREIAATQFGQAEEQESVAEEK